MLIELYGKNFGCFRDEFRLSMLATDIDRDNDRGIVRVKIEGDDEPLDLLRCVAIYGPNASGKSTVLKAAESISSLLNSSLTSKSNEVLHVYDPFALSRKAKDPSEIGVKVVVQSKVYHYYITFDGKGILAERLEQLTQAGTIVLIDRNGESVKGNWTLEEQFKLIIQSYRSNALLLALADSFAPRLASDIAVTLRGIKPHESPADRIWFSVHDDDYAAATKAMDDEEFASWLRINLIMADVGVQDYRIEESDGQQYTYEGLQIKGDPTIGLSLLHRSEAQPIAMPFSRESFGTRQFIKLAPLFFDLTHTRVSQIALRDEIDSSIHPFLLRHLIEFLNSSVAEGQMHGQLIFTTHETSLLDGEAKNGVLRRDQVYFTEKDSDGAARLYSLAEFKERNNLNIRRRYLQGRYGALPALGSFTE